MNFQETKKFIEDNSQYVSNSMKIFIWFIALLFFIVTACAILKSAEGSNLFAACLVVSLFIMMCLTVCDLITTEFNKMVFTKKRYVNSDVLEIFNQIDAIQDGEYKSKLICFFDEQNFDFLNQNKSYKRTVLAFDILKQKLKNVDRIEANAIADSFIKKSNIQKDNKNSNNQNI